MKSKATSESRPRAPAFRFQGDGVASINMSSIGALSDEEADDPVVKTELLELASVCEEVANNIEDHLTGG
jgi:hypothetical protein